MTTRAQQQEAEFPHLEVIPAAAAEAPIIENLLELYVHDFSEFRDVEIGEDGRFGYPPLALYWSEPDRHPFVVKVDGKLAGLVLVKRGPGISGSQIPGSQVSGSLSGSQISSSLSGSQISSNGAVWDMAEFFILRGCRRRGIGTQVAHQVWRRFPGPWEVRVMQANVPAQGFWAGAISRFVGEVIHPVPIEKAGERWTLFSFESKFDSKFESKSDSKSETKFETKPETKFESGPVA